MKGIILFERYILLLTLTSVNIIGYICIAEMFRLLRILRSAYIYKHCLILHI